jgi:hypothetical protein
MMCTWRRNVMASRSFRIVTLGDGAIRATSTSFQSSGRVRREVKLGMVTIDFGAPCHRLGRSSLPA